MEITSLGFRTDVALLAASGSEITDHGTHLVVRTPSNPGFHWGNFLLLPAPPGPGDAARWAALFAMEFPDTKHLAFGVDGVDGRAGLPAEHAALGLTAEVSTVLTAAQLRPPSTAPGAEVRALTGDDDWQQALTLEFACHGLPANERARRFAERRVAGFRAQCEAGNGSWVGAFVAGRLRAGAGLFTAGPTLARFQNVATHPDFRRRGLASAVLRHAARHALPDGPTTRTLVIVADPDYHAVRLYRSLGFMDTEHQVQLHRAS
ncbi:GNAT family N-acetyltransferase [Streptomyces tateyamensis]|uniref:GNAT family N-acetyltransferase n=1 Tax=Streptomyces tateyamensis TaxID=565073 RepID=A0A2V4MSU4_9ACTN|nr:N-acetyltransferase [Streptomyces tateyamensis]PYC66068.1 GNAT family N-acetyltransferase [Streptomyces tateyamensis]